MSGQYQNNPTPANRWKGRSCRPEKTTIFRELCTVGNLRLIMYQPAQAEGTGDREMFSVKEREKLVLNNLPEYNLDEFGDIVHHATCQYNKLLEKPRGYDYSMEKYTPRADYHPDSPSGYREVTESHTN